MRLFWDIPCIFLRKCIPNICKSASQILPSTEDELKNIHIFFSSSSCFCKKSTIQVFVSFIPEEAEIPEILSTPQLMSFAPILLH